MTSGSSGSTISTSIHAPGNLHTDPAWIACQNPPDSPR
jgi:hypothetical protein